ncbi:hypothetical protein JCM17380_32980 [Desulfosporosinus burensis]
MLQEAPLPNDIEKLGAEGINRIWRDNKLRAVGMKRAKSQRISDVDISAGSSWHN